MRLSGIVAINLSLILFATGFAFAAPPYPDSFPAEFPQYKSCNMVQIMNFPNNESAMLECGATPMNEIYEFYSNNARQNGWQILMENNGGDFMLFMAEKGDQAVQVQVATDKGATQLGLSLIKKE